MADTPKKTNGTATDAAADDTTATEVAADLSKTPGGPSAGTEPSAQAASQPASTTASQPGSAPKAASRPASPPLPASYDMPDDYADESVVDRAKAWVESNPALAVLAAAGIGLVVGRLAMGLAPEPEPPSLQDRIEKRARQIAKEAGKGGRRAASAARGWSGDAGDTLRVAADRAADRASDLASAGADRSRDLADALSDAVKVAAAKVVDEWVSRVKR